MHKIKKVAVIGEGKMGSSIFLYLNGFDFHLTWLCSSEDERDKARSVFSTKDQTLMEVRCNFGSRICFQKMKKQRLPLPRLI